MSSLGSGLRATDAFLLSTLSKHLLRETRLADMAVKDTDSVRFNNAQRRWAMVGNTTKADPDEVPDDEDEVEAPAVSELERSSLPTKPNPLNVGVYGQIMLSAKSYQSALCMPFRLCSLSSSADLPQFTSSKRTTTLRMTLLYVCPWPSLPSAGRCSVSRTTDTTSSLR